MPFEINFIITKQIASISRYINSYNNYIYIHIDYILTTIINEFLLNSYLRAQNGNAEEAAKYVREGSKWRLRFKPQSIKINDVATLLREFGCWIGPTAKNGYPIVWIENFSAYKTINSMYF